MRVCSGKMRFYCHLLVVSFVIEAAVAANATASAGKSDGKSVVETEKNKRQVNQFLRTPGTSAATSLGNEPEPQAFPLQLSHGIYSQQRVPLYTRRPTTISKPQVTEDVDEQELQPQQQQQQSILPGYYNYVPDIDEDENPDTAHIDSRHLPVEPRNKLQQYQSTPPQRIQYSYSPVPVTPKQNTPGQTLISEDEYLELIRNTDLAKNAQTAGTKTAFSYATASPTTSVVDYEYSTKSQSQTQFSNNHEFKKYSSRTQVPSTASSPVPHLQPQNSQQQFVRQPVHYLQPTSHYVTSGPTQDYSATYDKDVIRVNLKKYHEPVGKTKYDPARGQYHQEVKPTKKLTNFKPSYQYATTPQIQQQQQPQQQQQQQLQPQLSSSNQQTIVQSQPLHYQSVQQISQTDQSKSNQQQPQSQYSIVVPQSHVQAQQAYYPAESNHPFQTYLTQNERLVSNPFGQNSPEPAHLQATAPQQSESKPGQPDFRIQYIQHEYTATPTPTPTPRARYVPENTPSQPLKYELYEPNGAAPKEQPKVKLVPAPQHVQRPQYAPPPQYYKKIKVQPAAHVHYVPVRQQQYHQPTPQPSESSPQAQSDLYQLQPSRSTLFVSTAQSDSVSPSASTDVEKQPQQIPSAHQTHSEPRKPPLPITSPKKPISQAEFQALIDAGYKVQAIPVPVPVPVSAEKYKQLQYQQQQQSQIQPRPQHHLQHNPNQHHLASHQVPHTRQAPTHYIRYHPKHESEEGILTSYLKPIIDYIGGPGQ